MLIQAAEILVQIQRTITFLGYIFTLEMFGHLKYIKEEIYCLSNGIRKTRWNSGIVTKTVQKLYGVVGLGGLRGGGARGSTG